MTSSEDNDIHHGYHLDLDCNGDHVADREEETLEEKVARVGHIGVGTFLVDLWFDHALVAHRKKH